MSQEAPDPDLGIQQIPGDLEKKFVLCLYVGGSSPGARRAVASIKKICDEHLSGQYELEVIDVFQQPERAQADKVVAAPTLIRRRPLPVRRISGDLSQPGRLLRLLGVPQ